MFRKDKKKINFFAKNFFIFWYFYELRGIRLNFGRAIRNQGVLTKILKNFWKKNFDQNFEGISMVNMGEPHVEIWYLISIDSKNWSSGAIVSIPVDVIIFSSFLRHKDPKMPRVQSTFVYDENLWKIWVKKIFHTDQKISHRNTLKK